MQTVPFLPKKQANLFLLPENNKKINNNDKIGFALINARLYFLVLPEK